MLDEQELFRLLFPPDGAVPFELIDRVNMIRGAANQLLLLVSGQPLPREIGSHPSLTPAESMAANEIIIKLKEVPLPGGETRTWDEIASLVPGGLSPSACRKRYQLHKARTKQIQHPSNITNLLDSPARELSSRSETENKNIPNTGIQDQGQMQGPEARAENDSADNEDGNAKNLQDSGPMAAEDSNTPAGQPQNEGSQKKSSKKDPKIPHSEDKFILDSRKAGRKFIEILEDLTARGIACNVDDVVARHKWALLKSKKETKSTELKHKSSPQNVKGNTIDDEELDEIILDMAEDGAPPYEISVALQRKHNVTLSTIEIQRRIRKHKLDSRPDPDDGGED